MLNGHLILQDDTPKPTNKDVYIHDTPSATFYVSQYSGFSMDDITVTKHVRIALAPAAGLGCLHCLLDHQTLHLHEC